MKTFHGCIFMDRAELEKVGIDHPIKVEYYKTKESNENLEEYGIEVIKTEYFENDIKIETACIENITDNETKADRILNLLKQYQVTPIAAQDIVNDLIYE